MSIEMEALIEFLTGSKVSAAAVPWWMLRPEDIRVIRSWACETLPAGGQRLLFRALRNAMRGSTPEGEDPTSRPPMYGPIRLSRGKVPGRGVGPREARLLLQSCRDASDVFGRRDTAIMSLMLLAGLRRQEVVSLQTGDLDDENGSLTVRSGKRQTRSIMLMGQCRDDLNAWLEQRGHSSGPLFTRFDKRGHIVLGGLDPSGLNRLLAIRCRCAGGLRMTPRDLRSRFLWQMRLAGRRDERPPCRYYQDDNGQPAWTLASMSSP